MGMVKRNKSKANWSTDLDILFNFKNNDDPIFWTAPKWLTEGDIIFFYHTKGAKTRTNKLLTEAQEKLPSKKNLTNLLRRAKYTADLYSGSIFACALVSGSTQIFEKQKKHFISRLFAPLKEVHIFENPLPQELFADCVKIGLNTITPLYQREFTGIKRHLGKQNKIPQFLQNAKLGDKSFRNINANNWHSISSIPQTKFSHEGQLRNYLIDFFLKELKDKGTALLEECECFRAKRNTGRADYFVKILGQWIPVEVKLNISREKKLLAQVAKYINIDSFSPKKGAYRNKTFSVAQVPLCLILDQLGIYFISQNGTFIGSSFEDPFWKREQFTKNTILEIREAIRSNLIEYYIDAIHKKKGL
jgi:hypothetical protein